MVFVCLETCYNIPTMGLDAIQKKILGPPPKFMPKHCPKNHPRQQPQTKSNRQPLPSPFQQQKLKAFDLGLGNFHIRPFDPKSLPTDFSEDLEVKEFTLKHDNNKLFLNQTRPVTEELIKKLLREIFLTEQISTVETSVAKKLYDYFSEHLLNKEKTALKKEINANHRKNIKRIILIEQCNSTLSKLGKNFSIVTEYSFSKKKGIFGKTLISESKSKELFQKLINIGVLKLTPYSGITTATIANNWEEKINQAFDNQATAEFICGLNIDEQGKIIKLRKHIRETLADCYQEILPGTNTIQQELMFHILKMERECGKNELLKWSSSLSGRKREIAFKLIKKMQNKDINLDNYSEHFSGKKRFELDFEYMCKKFIHSIVDHCCHRSSRNIKIFTEKNAPIAATAAPVNSSHIAKISGNFHNGVTSLWAYKGELFFTEKSCREYASKSIIDANALDYVKETSKGFVVENPYSNTPNYYIFDTKEAALKKAAKLYFGKGRPGSVWEEKDKHYLTLENGETKGFYTKGEQENRLQKYGSGWWINDHDGLIRYRDEDNNLFVFRSIEQLEATIKDNSNLENPARLNINIPKRLLKFLGLITLSAYDPELAITLGAFFISPKLGAAALLLMLNSKRVKAEIYKLVPWETYTFPVSNQEPAPVCNITKVQPDNAVVSVGYPSYELNGTYPLHNPVKNIIIHDNKIHVMYDYPDTPIYKGDHITFLSLGENLYPLSNDKVDMAFFLGDVVLFAVSNTSCFYGKRMIRDRTRVYEYKFDGSNNFLGYDTHVCDLKVLPPKKITLVRQTDILDFPDRHIENWVDLLSGDGNRLDSKLFKSTTFLPSPSLAKGNENIFGVYDTLSFKIFRVSNDSLQTVSSGSPGSIRGLSIDESGDLAYIATNEGLKEFNFVSEQISDFSNEIGNMIRHNKEYILFANSVTNTVYALDKTTGSTISTIGNVPNFYSTDAFIGTNLYHMGSSRIEKHKLSPSASFNAPPGYYEYRICGKLFKLQVSYSPAFTLNNNLTGFVNYTIHIPFGEIITNKNAPYVGDFNVNFPGPLPPGISYDPQRKILIVSPQKEGNYPLEFEVGQPKLNNTVRFNRTLRIVCPGKPYIDNQTCLVNGFNGHAFTKVIDKEVFKHPYNDPKLTYKMYYIDRNGNKSFDLPENMVFDPETLTISGTLNQTLNPKRFFITATDFLDNSVDKEVFFNVSSNEVICEPAKSNLTINPFAHHSFQVNISKICWSEDGLRVKLDFNPGEFGLQAKKIFNETTNRLTGITFTGISPNKPQEYNIEYTVKNPYNSKNKNDFTVKVKPNSPECVNETLSLSCLSHKKVNIELDLNCFNPDQSPLKVTSKKLPLGLKIEQKGRIIRINGTCPSSPNYKDYTIILNVENNYGDMRDVLIELFVTDSIRCNRTSFYEEVFSHKPFVITYTPCEDLINGSIAYSPVSVPGFISVANNTGSIEFNGQTNETGIYPLEFLAENYRGNKKPIIIDLKIINNSFTCSQLEFDLPERYKWWFRYSMTKTTNCSLPDKSPTVHHPGSLPNWIEFSDNRQGFYIRISPPLFAPLGNTIRFSVLDAYGRIKTGKINFNTGVEPSFVAFLIALGVIPIGAGVSIALAFYVTARQKVIEINQYHFDNATELKDVVLKVDKKKSYEAKKDCLKPCFTALTCIVGADIMRNPAIVYDEKSGNTYEDEAIRTWLTDSSKTEIRDPLSNVAIFESANLSANPHVSSFNLGDEKELKEKVDNILLPNKLIKVLTHLLIKLDNCDPKKEGQIKDIVNQINSLIHCKISGKLMTNPLFYYEGTIRSLPVGVLLLVKPKEHIICRTFDSKSQLTEEQRNRSVTDHRLKGFIEAWKKTKYYKAPQSSPNQNQKKT
ncbi:hypothetical protein ACFLZV_03260 [Candidatus Margulisiibacteriota bacterium]